MNVPLKWLSDYVDLPKDVDALTQKLTSIGHMLDKVKEVEDETVVDLELRGNRPDLLGLVGIAREVAAAFSKQLKLPTLKKLPPKDLACSLVQVEKNAISLVQRYTAFTLNVKIRQSPDWMIKRLASLGVPSINNVVDITNYAMIETGQPLHAFDLHKLSGKRLVLRKAKDGEKFSTVQQGLTVVLSSDDLAICDAKKPQCLNLIGGWDSKVTDQTTEILIEAAVYNQANVRRSSRRLKIMTDGSIRHEKLLDPNQVETALMRAYHLLCDLADAKPTSKVSDYYPIINKPKQIPFDLDDVERLGGVKVSPVNAKEILEKLEFKYGKIVVAPTFRTDIEQPADIVEEILRIYGYDNIPSTPISGSIPMPQSYPSYTVQEKLRDMFISAGLDEVVALTMIDNKHTTPQSIKLLNPPDPDMAVLRTSLIPGIITHANRHRVFEIGKVFWQEKNIYQEKLSAAIALNGSVYDVKGIVEKFGLTANFGKTGNIAWAEIEVSKLPNTNPYSIVSIYPPIIEDINIKLDKPYASLINQIKKISGLIKQIDLIDKYGDKLTLRLTYHSPDRQLSSKDVAPIREKLSALVQYTAD